MLFLGLPLMAESVVVRVADPATWTTSQLSAYVGKTVTLADDWYLCSNYNGYTISPRRIFSPTNQALPASTEYRNILTLNNSGVVSLAGVSGYHRTGERLHNAVVTISSIGYMTLQSGEWVGNSRADILQGYDTNAIDARDTHTLLICASNLEYYLVENHGTGYGPDTEAEHQKQRQKVSQALALINADIYGFVEVERGQSALKELAADLHKNTGRNFTYINDGGSAQGSYTKSGYVYCSDKVKPRYQLQINNTGVDYRKFMQCFEELATGERFIFSLNHFKAKSGNGSGDNADQGDGQGNYNGDRVREAESVLAEYQTISTVVEDPDILIMGDLNAYAKEDPIRVLTEGGMKDLHRVFHADSSYSYTYHSEAGYLDHALCSASMLPQVTGMVAYHINSDERDCYTYDGSCNDGTIFRYSDHDPILVGLRLQKYAAIRTELFCDPNLLFRDGYATIHNAAGGTLRLYHSAGFLTQEMPISSTVFTIPTAQLPSGIYVAHIFYDGKVLQRKLIIP